MTFTKEQAELHAFITGFLSDPMHDDKSANSMTAEVFRIALAALTAEPVAYMYKDNLHTDARFSLHTRFGNWSQEDINEYEITEIPLYAAPPAPVVPAEIRNRFRAEGLAELLKDARDYAPLTAGQWETLTKNWHQTFVGLSGEGDTCSTAMLQGAEPSELSFREIPNSSTNNCRENAETSTNGWIPCSERLPENSDAVLVCQEGGIVFCAEFDCGEFYPDEFPNVPKQGREITHWMPLPAAPQQEVKL